jgi:hypothetical protein
MEERFQGKRKKPGGQNGAPGLNSKPNEAYQRCPSVCNPKIEKWPSTKNQRPVLDQPKSSVTQAPSAAASKTAPSPSSLPGSSKRTRISPIEKPVPVPPNYFTLPDANAASNPGVNPNKPGKKSSQKAISSPALGAVLL